MAGCRDCQLWIQTCDHDPADGTCIATTILRRVERESLAELGVGDLARRRDPTWASSILVEQYDESIPSDVPEEAEDPREQLVDQDRDLLLDLALAANLAVAPLHRGRAGLTTPSVAQLVSEDHALAARTIRRHAAGALDALAKVAREGGLGM